MDKLNTYNNIQKHKYNSHGRCRSLSTREAKGLTLEEKILCGFYKADPDDTLVGQS